MRLFIFSLAVLVVVAATAIYFTLFSKLSDSQTTRSVIHLLVHSYEVYSPGRQLVKELLQNVFSGSGLGRFGCPAATVLPKQAIGTFRKAYYKARFNNDPKGYKSTLLLQVDTRQVLHW